MRSLFTLGITAVLLSSCSPSHAAKTEAVDGGVRSTLSVAFAGSGRGSVRSIDGTLSCSATCSRSVPSGTMVQLVAEAAQGSQFVGWSGACSGASGCDVAVSSDRTTTATFDQDETPPQSPPTSNTYLRVARSGAGKVTSDVGGIDCGLECRTVFRGTVTLTATADSGFSFVGWGGACSGSGACVIAQANTAVVVLAFFERLPPLPADCEGLMTESLPAPVAIWFGDDLVEGTSDGTGENFVFTTAPEGIGTVSRAYHFIRIRDGAVTETAVRQVPYINDYTTYSVPRKAESQPEGFDVFRSFGLDLGLVFDVHAPDGTLLKTQSVNQPLQTGETSQLGDYLIAPSGGVATIRLVWKTSVEYEVRYGRFDSQGNVLVTDVPVDLDGGFVASWGVDRAGNVLLVSVKGGAPGYGVHPVYGRWLAASGAPMTDWFSVGDVYVRNPFLVVMHDGLALGEDESGYFTHVFRSGEAKADVAPDWLTARPRQRLALVRGGRAFVSLAPVQYDPIYGPCAEGIEILTATGTSCGCVAIPDVLLSGYVQSVGRDGSLIAFRWDSLTPHAWFAVYPDMFR